MADNPRAHRKALPTFSGRGEIDTEAKVVDRLVAQLLESSDVQENEAVGDTLADVCGESFDMGGAGGTAGRAFSKGPSSPTIEEGDKAEILRWAEAGWPKRVVYAIASAWQGNADDARLMLALENDAALLVGPDMMPNWAKTVESMMDDSIPDGDGEAPQEEESEHPDDDTSTLRRIVAPSPPGSTLCDRSSVQVDDVYSWQDAEFFIDEDEKVRQNRLVVLQRGPCTTPYACEKASCPRAATALWHFVGVYREWVADQELCAALDPEDLGTQDEWEAQAKRTFEALPGLRACENRVALRVDTTRIPPRSGDQGGFYLSLPLPTACHAGDFEVCIVSIDVTTD
jgi:hypothetical protein